MEYRFTVSRACHKGDKILSSRAWEKEGVMIHHLLGHHRPIYRGVSGGKTMFPGYFTDGRGLGRFDRQALEQV